MSNQAWDLIFKTYNINQHNFQTAPFVLTADEIKKATKHLSETSEREPRILCKHDTRESRPQIFITHDLFILPVKNGIYNILKGEGYIDIPTITSPIQQYQSKLAFSLDTAKVGNSEMQHLDFAYASSLIRHFLGDNSLVLTIRGRKYTPAFRFTTDQYQSSFFLDIESVQTEVDAGYEGQNQVVLIEAKNAKTTNTIIRQLYYPFRQWQTYTSKSVKVLFFEKRDNIYSLWEFSFNDPNNYNSIVLLNSARFEII